jgi:hypothetical protein
VQTNARICNPLALDVSFVDRMGGCFLHSIEPVDDIPRPLVDPMYISFFLSSYLDQPVNILTCVDAQNVRPAMYC